MIWTQFLLFVILSPGVILTLPPVGSKIFFSGKTCITAVLVHAAVFAVVYHFALKALKDYKMDGFASAVSAPAVPCSPNGTIVYSGIEGNLLSQVKGKCCSGNATSSKAGNTYTYTCMRAFD